MKLTKNLLTKLISEALGDSEEYDYEKPPQDEILMDAVHYQLFDLILPKDYEQSTTLSHAVHDEVRDFVKRLMERWGEVADSPQEQKRMVYDAIAAILDLSEWGEEGERFPSVVLRQKEADKVIPQFLNNLVNIVENPREFSPVQYGK